MSKNKGKSKGRGKDQEVISEALVPVLSRVVTTPADQGWYDNPNSNDGPISTGKVVGGRLSVDNEQSFFGAPHVVLSPKQAEADWSLYRLDSKTLSRISPVKLMELLADLSPDVSRALWDFLRLCNPGWECIVMDQPPVFGKQGDIVLRGNPDPVGQKMVDNFFVTLEDYYGSVDVVIGRLFMSAFMRGALMAEMVLDLDARNMSDLATPDPATIRFIRIQDPIRGPIWQMAQWQNRPSPVPGGISGYVPLDWPTIRYIPIDPFPGVPYGRPMASPALFATLFLLGLLHDLRRVISQQGYPRIDISVNLETLKNSLPAKILNDDKQYKKWVEYTIADVEKAYKRLEPDSTYIHTSVVEVNRPVGTVDSSSLGAVKDIILALERMAVRALKTMPFMMASTQTTTETLANREWEVQAAGTKTLQNHGAAILRQCFNIGMQAQGHIGYACWNFDQLRKTEALRDAQTDAIRIANAFNTYAHGFTSMDQSANAAVGHDADAPEPRFLQKGNIGMDSLTDSNMPQDNGSGAIGDNTNSRDDLDTRSEDDPLPFPIAIGGMS